MAGRKKRRLLGPRRKRMRRPARLQATVAWRTGYGGKNLVRGYARWFGVDLLCAVVELRMLGVEVDAGYEQQIRDATAARAAARAKRCADELAARTRSAEIDWPADWPSESIRPIH
jgi:hypothetical protein